MSKDLQDKLIIAAVLALLSSGGVIKLDMLRGYVNSSEAVGEENYQMTTKKNAEQDREIQKLKDVLNSINGLEVE